ncbi:MAG: CARDB domain-containing protein [Candidatus Altiarchaeota archaeon]
MEKRVACALVLLLLVCFASSQGTCGDGICTDWERSDGNCHDDCGGSVYRTVCGNGVCERGEEGVCTRDCGGGSGGAGLTVCGNGVCERGEEGVCSRDCGGVSQQDRAPPTDEELIALGKIACLGVEEGGKCLLPNDMESGLGLSGVCCGGGCSYRKTSCANKSAAVDKPDLIVSSIEVTPQNPTEDVKVNVTVKVGNIGKAPVAGGFWIQLSVEEDSRLLDEDDFEVKGRVDAGETVTHTFTGKLGFGRIGSYRMKAVADSSGFEHRNNLVEEADEKNNVGVRTVYVAPEQRRESCGDGICGIGEDGSCERDCRIENRTGGVVDYCGDGLCSRGEEDICAQDCGKEEGIPGAYIVVGSLIVLTASLALAAVILIRSRRKETPREPGKENGLEELVREKEELENMLSIAKAKYHRRELDEESFREITRDKQKRLIELELGIKNRQG